MNISPKSVQGVVEGLSTAEWNVMFKKIFFLFYKIVFDNRNLFKRLSFRVACI